MNDPQTAEPDNPAAWAFARHITEQPMSTVLAALRILGWPITFELQPEEAPPAPLRRSEDDCPGFPEQCPNLRSVEPEPGVHLGGVRCGCADAAPAAVQTEEA